MPESHKIPTIYEGLQFLQLVKHHIKNNNSKSQEVNVNMYVLAEMSKALHTHIYLYEVAKFCGCQCPITVSIE